MIDDLWFKPLPSYYEDGVRFGTGPEMIAEIKRLREEIKANDDGLAKLLREIEWRGDVYEMDGQRFEVCPLCEQDKDDGHSPDCSLARWIAKVEAGK